MTDSLPVKADLTDEQITDMFYNKVFTDDEPEGEPPTLPKVKQALTPTEIEFVRAAMTPVERLGKDGRVRVNRWAGICDVERMVKLVRQEPALLTSIGPLLIRASIAMRGCEGATKFLLDHGVPVVVAETGYNVLHEAAWAGCMENLRLVFEAGAVDATGVARTVHTGWPDTVSLLYWSVFKPNAQAELLLRYGADPEAPIKGNGERGITVLQHAVAPPYDGAAAPWPNPERIQSGMEFADLVLAHGAHFDLYSACGRDDLERVRELVGEDAEAVVRPGEAHMTPLHWAVRGNATRCTKWLLARGADVDAETVSGRSALHMAAEWGHTEMIWLLAERGADLNGQDSKGRSALHRATYTGQVEAAEVLIVLGADVRRETKAGKTALQLARYGCKFLKTKPSYETPSATKTS